MTNRLAAALAAGTLAVGILVGAAGTVLVRDTTRPAWAMGDMAGMHAMMSSSMMDGASRPMDADDHAHHSGADR